jgi:ribose 5-phosphate isomerase A
VSLSPNAESEAPAEAYKRQAAERALGLVQPEMTIGLGTGSTVRYFIEALGRRVGAGLKVECVSTSVDTAHRARRAGITLRDAVGEPLDLAVDGADEIDPACNCVKGRGGALLREKIVARAARRFVLVADESKLVPRLGRGPIPVEVLPFLWEVTSRHIAALGGRPSLRLTDWGPYHTDNGNLILDVSVSMIEDPGDLDRGLHAIPGVIEHGLFIGLARSAIVAGPTGIHIVGEPIAV